MHSSLTAVVLCIFAQTAFAAPAPEAIHDVRPASLQAPKAVNMTPAVIATPAVVTAPAKVAARPGGSELIKSAAAGTRDDAPPSASVTHSSKGEQDHPRRGGTAMLLAALALMSGIALRRYGAPGR